MNEKLLAEYKKNKGEIRERLKQFKDIKEKDYFDELIFCLLTPQSNAKRCWTAVEEIIRLDRWDEKNISNILKKYTRFHNNKTKYVLEAKKNWGKVRDKLKIGNAIELRNYLADNVKGFGLKEASHFLRNIGRSDNQIAILDRNILKNLKEINIIKEDRIQSKKDYLDIEQKFLRFANEIKIKIDEMDLLFWSKENGDIFK